MKLVPMPKEKYEYYKQRLMFEGYKWDPQFVDNNTVAKYVLVLSEDEARTIADYTSKLAKETMEAEEFINNNLHKAKSLRLPKRLKKEIQSMTNYDTEKNIRLMRFDFHPTTDGGFAISEVNSDVPGGHAEGSVVPAIAKEILEQAYVKGMHNEKSHKALDKEWPITTTYGYMDFSSFLVDAISKKVPKNGTIFLNHCTCYSDDRQVMEFDADRLRAAGYKVIIGAADHISFKDNKAYSILDGNWAELDGIFRYTPVEWLMDIKPKRWQGYFNTETVACNHPVSLYAQTKRFPFVWNMLEENNVAMSTWRELLPETVEAKDVLSGKYSKEEFIYKPAYGRVGEKISIKEACKEDEYRKILKEVRKHPKRYIAQRRFASQPLEGINGEKLHVCIGSYAVEGEHAGFYARVSHLLRIDSNAADIPVLIEMNQDGDGKKTYLNNIKLDTKDLNNPEYLSRQNNPKLSWDVYKKFVSSENGWSNWVRPVPFINIGVGKKSFANVYNEQHLFAKDEIAPFLEKTGIIVDMPGAESAMVGLNLAKEGFGIVPLFNGTIEQDGARATSDCQSASESLVWLGEKLQDINVADNGKPVFLLDSNRLLRFKRNINLFDNSWDIYSQDMPSVKYIKGNGINKILVIGEKIAPDLKRILLKYQKGGIDIYLKKIYEEPKKIKLRKSIIVKR